MHIAEIKLQYSSFIITHFMSRTILNIIRFYFCKDGNSAVSFFLCAEPIVEVTQFMERFVIYIFLSCLCFLQANNVGRIRFQPVQETFTNGSPQSVYVVRND